MGYCTIDDVFPVIDKSKTKRLLGLADTATDSQLKTAIEAYLPLADFEIESGLGAYYLLQITGDQSLKILKGIAIGILFGMIFLPNQDGNTPQRIQGQIDRARKLLDDYGDSAITRQNSPTPVKYLPDAPRQQKIFSKSNRALKVDSVLGRIGHGRRREGIDESRFV